LTVKELALYKTVISQGRVGWYSENKCHTYCIIYQWLTRECEGIFQYKIFLGSLQPSLLNEW
jgi:hypothetical protein